ncbi:hypothetical protein PENVUL_c120G02181 [Penicillium vulpinum]|uniref:Uncharacterized protein n=1 Tax=Penicillium vulpinum TaxID=29845 RepID=A0A1V6R1M6_9EURO|nr:hypothetical protein PENVUL_c120G02181 [Penicillium vulpinum]
MASLGLDYLLSSNSEPEIVPESPPGTVPISETPIVPSTEYSQRISESPIAELINR